MLSLVSKTLALMFCAVIVFMEPSCRHDSYQVKLSGPITVTDEWIELRSESPLRADKDLQWVLLELDDAFKDNSTVGPGTKKGILMPDGEVINPEITVTDQYGNVFNLGWGGTRRGASGYDLPYPEKFPQDREYKVVRVRSSRPIKVKAIYWFCDSAKDWK